MRLIDADKLCKDRVGNDPVRIAVMCEPTAFDLDAVVERLEEESSFFSGKPMGTLQKHFYCKGIKRAIEIVRGGGK